MSDEKFELAAAELSHPEHEQRKWRTVRPPRRAVTSRELAVPPAPRLRRCRHRPASTARASTVSIGAMPARSRHAMRASCQRRNRRRSVEERSIVRHQARSPPRGTHGARIRPQVREGVPAPRASSATPNAADRFRRRTRCRATHSAARRAHDCPAHRSQRSRRGARASPPPRAAAAPGLRPARRSSS